MKRLFTSFTFSENTRRIVTYLIYLCFTLYTLYQLFLEPTIAGKIAYAIILIVILGIACWAEYLKILYVHMVKSLAMDCDTSKTKFYYNKLKKRDFLKSYKNTLIIFDTLYYQDINQPEKCIQILNQNPKLFSSSLDMLLIRNYTYLYSYHQMQNRSKVNYYYTEICKLKGTKIKGKKVSPLFNWDFIDSIYAYSIKDYKKSKKLLLEMYRDNLNNRELSQYYIMLGNVYRKLDEKKEACEAYQMAIQKSNQLCYAKRAKACLYEMR